MKRSSKARKISRTRMCLGALALVLIASACSPGQVEKAAQEAFCTTVVSGADNWWTFDQTVVDETHNRLPISGQQTSASFRQGRFGEAYSSSGQDVAPDTQLGDGFTISFFLRGGLRSWSTSEQTYPIIDPEGWGIEILQDRDNDKLRIDWLDGSGSQWTAVSSQSWKDQWYHIVISQTGVTAGGLHVWVDGAPIGFDSVVSSSSFTASLTRPGTLAEQSTFSSKQAGGPGDVDELLVFRRVFDDDERACLGPNLYSEVKTSALDAIPPTCKTLIESNPDLHWWPLDGNSKALMSSNSNGHVNDAVWDPAGIDKQALSGEFVPPNPPPYAYDKNLFSVVPPKVPATGDDNSLGFWIRLDSTQNVARVLAHWGVGLSVSTSDSEISAEYVPFGTDVDLASTTLTTPLTVADWHHIVVIQKETSNGADAEFWVDGVKVADTPFQATTKGVVTTSDFMLSGSFDGALDEIVFASRAMTSQEVGCFADSSDLAQMKLHRTSYPAVVAAGPSRCGGLSASDVGPEGSVTVTAFSPSTPGTYTYDFGAGVKSGTGNVTIDFPAGASGTFTVTGSFTESNGNITPLGTCGTVTVEPRVLTVACTISTSTVSVGSLLEAVGTAGPTGVTGTWNFDFGSSSSFLGNPDNYRHAYSANDVGLRTISATFTPGAPYEDLDAATVLCGEVEVVLNAGSCVAVIAGMNPVAWWPFDEKVNGAYPEAITGNPDWAAQEGNVAVDTLAGQVGNAARLDGGQLTLSSGPATSGPESLNVSFWFRPVELKTSSFFGGAGWNVGQRTGGTYTWSLPSGRTSGSSASQRLRGQLTEGEWVHVVIRSYPGSGNIRSYIDGVFAYTNGAQPGFTSLDWIGASNTEFEIDDLVWFDRNITEAEIQDLHDCGSLGGTAQVDPPPECVVAAPLGGGSWQVGDSIVFSTDPSTLVDWDFGDGNTDSQADVTVHEYQTAGTFQASFTFEGTSYDCPAALTIDDSVLDTNYEVACSLTGVNLPSVTALMSSGLPATVSGTASFDFEDAVLPGTPFWATYVYAAGSSGLKQIEVTFTPDAGSGYGPVTELCSVIDVTPADDPDDEEEDVLDEDDCVFEDSGGDVDGDGILNGQENEVGTDPCSPDCNAEAANAFPESDFDGDGIVNGQELELGTNPCSPDCNEELAEAFPEADFDGDRVPNIVELEEGSNPCDPESTPG